MTNQLTAKASFRGASNKFFCKIMVIVAAVTTAIAVTKPATALDACAPRNEVITALGQKFAEAPTAIGLTSDGRVIEVFANANGGTFTIIITTTAGLSCVAVEGEAWQRLPRLVAGRES